MRCDRIISLLGLMQPNPNLPNSCKYPALVLEYMEGGSLEGLLNSIYRKPAAAAASTAFTLEQIKAISLDVIEGLDYLHS